MIYLIQGNVDDGDTTLDIDCVSITAERLVDPSVNMVILEKLLQICIAVGTRYSFSVRWFVSLNFLKICCTSNIPNLKISMGLMVWY